MKLFARQGFQGTTTRQIAEQAQVNEAIVFRHFPSKEELYWTVIEEKCRATAGREHLERELPAKANGAAGLEEKKILASIAEGILRRNTEDATLSRLLLFSALENHRLSHRFFRTYIADYYDTLAAHIRQRIRAGAFRRIDPVLAARSFLGMVIYHFLVQELFGGRRYQKFGAHAVCETLAEIWLEGIRTPRRRPAPRGRRDFRAT
jgi:AcrR family transcriptional regulator